MKKGWIYFFIILSFIGMITFFALDIFEILPKGMGFGFIFGSAGTLLQTLSYWKSNRFNALLQLFSSLIFVVVTVLYFIK